ncbi:MAG TPA: prephenate dehydrogenase [Streptosporangiaceae bacterium]|nr:prephenate dehydrogenase [Streptosporangiaceae bacterium]
MVIGAGLIGTSVALAMRARGARVWLADRDPAAAQLAADIGAGQVLPDSLTAAGDPAPAGRAGGLPADMAVLAVPPAAVAAELAAAQARGLARCYTDVASVKELPLARARDLGCDLASYVPGHPLSGRERSGPAAARADLFLGRPWVLCPGPDTAPAAVAAATALALACGAQPVSLTAAEHDRWVALVSHVPHLVAGGMAARLEHAPGGALGLAGQGLRDVTRIAASDPGLWTQILTANAGPVAEILADVAAELQAAAAALARISSGDEDAVKELVTVLERANAGVARIPGKRGGPAPDYAIVQVVIPDRPGELARLFEAAGEAGINIEDVGIEHSPGLPAGVAELAVRPEAVARLTSALAAGGWPVRR